MVKGKKVKADIHVALPGGDPTSELRMKRHSPYGIIQCYLPPDTSERAPPNPSRYSINLPQRDGRLSWPSWLDSAPAGSRTSDLSITSPTPDHCTTETMVLLLLWLLYVNNSFFSVQNSERKWHVAVPMKHMYLVLCGRPIRVPNSKQRLMILRRASTQF